VQRARDADVQKRSSVHFLNLSLTLKIQTSAATVRRRFFPFSLNEATRQVNDFERRFEKNAKFSPRRPPPSTKKRGFGRRAASETAF
jgi:hypothetical protein